MRRMDATCAAALSLASCGLPFGIGRPSTADLENGAAAYLTKAKSFEMAGSFTRGSDTFKLDVQFTTPSTLHEDVTKNGVQVELIQAGGKVYYRGAEFVAGEVGSDASGKTLAKAIGNRWFTSEDATPIDTSSILDANKVKANFLTTIASTRHDDVKFKDENTAELTAFDVIVNITESSPYRVVRVRSIKGKTVDGNTDADIAVSNYNKDFGIQAPSDVFDVDDMSTWPPLYTVIDVSNARCSVPCTLSAVLQNQGGLTGAPAPSSVTFTLKNHSNGSLLGSCKATISPDVAHGSKVTKSCTISSSAWANFSGDYTYTATLSNPAYD
jgi:hypothetical protein